jgi:IS66 C-terminal element
MYSLMVTTRLNNVDPRVWLADVLARIGDHSRPAFLLLVRVLGKLFRRLFLTKLIALHDARRLAVFA